MMTLQEVGVHKSNTQNDVSNDDKEGITYCRRRRRRGERRDRKGEKRSRDHILICIVSLPFCRMGGKAYVCESECALSVCACAPVPRLIFCSSEKLVFKARVYLFFLDQCEASYQKSGKE